MSELVKVDSNPALIRAAQGKQSPQAKGRSEGWWLGLAGEWRSGGKDCACHSCRRKRDEVSRRVLRRDGELLQRLAREGPVVLGVHAANKTDSMNMAGKITADVSDGDCESGMWVETWTYSYNQWVGVPTLLQDVLGYGIQPEADFDSDNAISHNGACCGWANSWFSFSFVGYYYPIVRKTNGFVEDLSIIRPEKTLKFVCFDQRFSHPGTTC